MYLLLLLYYIQVNILCRVAGGASTHNFRATYLHLYQSKVEEFVSWNEKKRNKTVTYVQPEIHFNICFSL